MVMQAEQSFAVALESSAQEILATVAHELRAPLSGIAGWTTLLEKGELSPERCRRAFEAIRRSVAVQRRLIEDLIDAARWAQGDFHISPARVDVAEIVTGAVAIVEPVAEHGGVALQACLPPSAIQVWGDVQRLQQVFCNLLVNAVKFSPRDSHVELHVERGDPLVRLRVRDHGIGIHRDFLPHVFERFRRGDPVRHRGLGLGLAIAHHIVGRHGGRISADSAGEGRGATFTVELPILEPSGAQPASAE